MKHLYSLNLKTVPCTF